MADGYTPTTVREEVRETVLPALGSPICLVHHNGERAFGRLVQIGWHAKTKAWTFTVSAQDVTP